MQEASVELIAKLQKWISIVHNPFAGWVILTISVVVTFSAYWFSSKQINERAEEQFEYRTEEITHAIYERMAIYEHVLHGASGLFAASKKVTRLEWHRYVESLGLSSRLPGIQGLGYAVVVNDKQQHIDDVRAEGFPDYTILPPGENELTTAIVYLEPFDWRNKRAFGFNMWSNELRRSAMARARDQAAIATTAKITLVQETESDVQHGFLTYIPVYQNGTVPKTLEGRNERLVGWVYAAFRAGDLMSGILSSADTDVSFRIYDGALESEASLLYASAEKLFRSEYQSQAAFSRVKTLMLQGREWTVRFNATENFMSTIAHTDQPKYILLVGVIVDALLFYVLLSLHFINKYIRRSAKQMEEEFEVNQKSLLVQTRLVEAAEKESEAFFELAPEAFLIVSKAGIVVKANQYAHHLFAYDKAELQNIYLEDLIPEGFRSGHAQYRFDYFQKPKVQKMSLSRNLVALKKTGEIFPTTINLEPIMFRGNMHVVAVVHDESQQRLLEQTMENARKKAESASRSKSDFVANMSHEIRTPLNAVLGAAQLLEKTKPDPSQRKFINIIRNSGEALLGVINDILDFSKVEAGCMELSSVPFDLHEVLSRVGLVMSMNSGEKDIELVIHVGFDVKANMIGDPLRLQQVLINLASNAIKFTGKGSVILRVEVSSVDDGLQALTFTMSDTGIGMAQGQQARLFKAFSQADESITRRFGGTGLGLAISSQIVELMSSEIHVSSSLGEGTAFSFTVDLPICENDVQSHQPMGERALQLLMVDDSSESSAAVKEIVSAWGCRLWVFNTWDEACLELSGTPLIQELDFVIVDWQMPIGGGQYIACDAMLDKLKCMGLRDDCGTVLLSSNNQCASLLLDDEQKQFDSTLTKPILTVSLLDCLDEALFKRTGQRLIAQKGSDAEIGRGIQGVQILLVEDNVFNQVIAQGLLEDMGANITIANNGEEALEFYRQGMRADIILMDVQMPVMDGLTATRMLREELACTLPIIAMTAGVLQSEREAYLGVGMNDIVPKPIDEKELYCAITKALKRPDGNACSKKSVKDVTKTPINKPLAFNSQRLELLSKGKSNRVKRIIESLELLAVEGAQTLDSGWAAVELGNKGQAHKLFHDLKGQVANYGGEIFGLSIQSLEQALHDDFDVKDVRPVFNMVLEDFHRYIALAKAWTEEQKSYLLGDFNEE